MRRPWHRLRGVAVGCGAAAWLAVMVVLAWYGARLSRSVDLLLLLAVIVGISTGMVVTRRWIALTVLPLIVFSVGGIALSTQVSNTHASDGGDWSDAAQAAFGGIWFGLIATAVIVVTALGRTGLLAVVHRAAPRRRSR